MRRWAAGSLLFLAISFAGLARAQTAVTVSGTVPTTVSATKSTLTSDAQTAPADGSTQVTLSIALVDDANNPVANSTIKVSSNRGNVDTILCYVNGTLSSSNTTSSDVDGLAKCVATSNAPGQATFSAFIDDQLTLNDKPAVTFTALPILQNLTVTVTLPGGSKITLFKPAPTTTTPPKPTPTSPTTGTEPSHTSGTGQLVNTGINVELSFGTFLVALLGLLLIPGLLIGVIILMRRDRKLLIRQAETQTEEKNTLNKIEVAQEQIAKDTAAIEEAVDTNQPKPPTS